MLFFAHKKFSHSFVTFRLNPWCHMDYFTDVLIFLCVDCGYPCNLVIAIGMWTSITKTCFWIKSHTLPLRMLPCEAVFYFPNHHTELLKILILVIFSSIFIFPILSCIIQWHMCCITHNFPSIGETGFLSRTMLTAHEHIFIAYWLREAPRRYQTALKIWIND